MPRDLIIEPAAIDLNRVICDQEQLRQFNPQRFEMEQLTAVCFEDLERHICVGYKDVAQDDFWVRGHMPDMPLMPGVVMVECAAQLCSYYVHSHSLLGPGVLIGLGGLDEVRVRGPVRPGDRMLIAAMLLKMRAGVMCVCQFQCFVADRLVCEGQIKGVALPTEELQQAS
ncbi:MAG: beta-hydroxyacyl-ACP dehydratase [Pirellulales bacterium]|nr:beta-hydroxyacyl-ACP dehydratase [Pirellulales bacterium]